MSTHSDPHPDPTRTVGVLVCTHDIVRLDMLRACLASLRDQTLEPDEVLVMVDGDDALAAQVRAALPGERVESMGTNQGVSRARNAGAELMKSDWVVFLDDDAVAEPGWLAALTRPLGAAGVLGSSGTSIPIWDVPRPAWLPDEYLWAFGCSYLGMPTTTTRVRNFFGGASAVDRTLFNDLGGFSDEVGHHGTKVGGGEEVVFCLSATQRTGGWFVFEPSAVAHHHLPASRLTWRYLVKRTYGEGRTKARLATLVDGEPLGDEKAFARRLPGAALRYAVRPSTFPRAVGLVVASVAVLAGMLVERSLARVRRR